jgi:hypothetical protein
MVCFQTKNPNLGQFWRALDWKMFVYFMAIWSILWRFGIFCDHLVHFVFIRFIFPVLVSCTKKNLATLVEKQKSKCENIFCAKICFPPCEKAGMYVCILRGRI